MPFEINVVSDVPRDNHIYRVYEPVDHSACITALAQEYRRLRTQFVANMGSISVEGIGVLNTSRLEALIAPRTIPSLNGGSLSIIRSDMGETIGYMVLEKEFNTLVGYKSVRDRELINLPGRGIDIVGIESDTDNNINLVLGETKVSSEDRNPPRVVDSKNDSISKTLKKHLNDEQVTISKIYEVARKTYDASVCSKILSAALYWDHGMWGKLHITCCGVLIRPMDRFQESDFGVLLNSPGTVSPATVRFIIFKVQNNLDDVVRDFYTQVLNNGAS